MTSEAFYLTPDFVVTQEPAPGSAAGRVEIWVDWMPHVDGNVDQPLQAWKDGRALVVAACEKREDGQAWLPRRLEGLSAEAWGELREELVWVVCGPSGVLSRRVVPVATP